LYLTLSKRSAIFSKYKISTFIIQNPSSFIQNFSYLYCINSLKKMCTQSSTRIIIGDYRLCNVSSVGSVYTTTNYQVDLHSKYNYYAFVLKTRQGTRRSFYIPTAIVGSMLQKGNDFAYFQKVVGSSGYRYGFNGQEKVDEIAGEGNHNTALFWEYDTRLGRRWNVDPLADQRISLTPYNFCSNNPILRVDPDGALDGDYYKQDGTYLGSDGINDNKTYVADEKKETKNDKGAVTKTEFVNSRELPVLHSTFLFMSQTLYAEASPNASAQEVAGIYSVCENRAQAYGLDGVIRTFTDKYPFGVYGTRAGARARYASEKGPGADTKRNNVHAGLILGIGSNVDYSNGGFFWDGTDFKSGGGHNARYKPGYLFTSTAHDIFNQGDNLKSGATKFGTWQYKYESTGAIGETTFSRLTLQWREAQLPKLNTFAKPLGDN
jgi:RHS repeat-associated protein